MRFHVSRQTFISTGKGSLLNQHKWIILGIMRYCFIKDAQ